MQLSILVTDSQGTVRFRRSEAAPGDVFGANDRMAEFKMDVPLKDLAPGEYLLTLHATKGLEFSRVYIVGVEDYQLPGYHALENENEPEIQEARRLLYVGMTRAKDRLVLTRAAQRDGRSSGGDLFLREAEVGATVLD